MKRTSIHSTCALWPSIALAAGLSLFLVACSSGKQPSTNQQPTQVKAVMPVQRTFHAKVAAYGQLAADRRTLLSLSLPHAVRVLATDVVAGQRVKRHAALLKLQTDPATRSAYLQAQAAVNVARQDLARSVRLHAQRLATNAQLDAARKALADARAALAAQAKLGGAHAVTTLRAPADGVVTTLNVQAGQQVTAGTALIQFTPTTALAAQLGVDPDAATAVRAGMPVVLHPVYASPGTPALHGTVAMVSAAVNPVTHLVDVIATLDKHVGMSAGTALSATIQTRQFKAWAVPRDALQSDAKGSYLFQIENGKAKRIYVKVLAPDGSPVGVSGVLDPNAPVIAIGSYEVSDGEAVKAQTGKAAP